MSFPYTPLKGYWYVMSTYSCHPSKTEKWRVHTRPIKDKKLAEFELGYRRDMDPKTKHEYFLIYVPEDNV